MSENLPHRASTAAPMQAAAWEGNLPNLLRAEFPALPLTFRTYLAQNFIELPAAAIPTVLLYLKDRQQFDILTDLTAVDYPDQAERFEVIYILYSFAKNEYLRLKTRVTADSPVPTVSNIYLGADWLEREVFDMFGIRFTGHPNLKRILLPEEWNGYPLRKDASITGMDNDWVRQNLDIESGQ